MKLLPVLLLNIVVAGAAVVVYDQVRSTDAPQGGDLDTATVDTSALEARLAALESREQPMLQAEGSDPRALARLEAFERRLRALETRSPASREQDPEEEDPQPARELPIMAAEGDPTPEEVSRFRKLQKASHRQVRRQKVSRRLAAVVDKLGISLTEDQQEQLVDAYADFEPRRSEMWQEAKSTAAAEGEDADWDRVIRETSSRIRRAFVDEIDDFIPSADAESIAGALNGK